MPVINEPAEAAIFEPTLRKPNRAARRAEQFGHGVERARTALSPAARKAKRERARRVRAARRAGR